MPRSGLRSFSFHVKNYEMLTALQVIEMYPDMGIHFEDGIKTVWHDLRLRQGHVRSILKDVRWKIDKED